LNCESLEFDDNCNRIYFSTRMRVNALHGDVSGPVVCRAASEGLRLRQRRRRPHPSRSHPIQPGLPEQTCPGRCCAHSGAAGAHIRGRRHKVGTNDGSRCHYSDGPGASVAAGPGAGSPLASAGRKATQPTRRHGTLRRKGGGCNCGGVALIVASEWPAAALALGGGAGGAPPALCKAMTAQVWPTRTAEPALLDLEDISGPLPLPPPWKRDAESEEDCQGQAAGQTRAANY
jgi:hypothetical protein